MINRSSHASQKYSRTSSAGSSSVDRVLSTLDKSLVTVCHDCSNEHLRFRFQECPAKPVFCDECGKKHIRIPDCPNIPCKICYNENHYRGNCPFLHSYPRGENFDKAKYEIVCHCGMPFDADKWMCTYSPHLPFPKLQLKRCEICQTFGDHITFECQENRELAAAHKLEFEARHAHRKFRKDEDTGDWCYCY